MTIPNSVTKINDFAFYACCSLTGVTIPNSVTTIGEDAFGGCSDVCEDIIESGDLITSTMKWTLCADGTLDIIGTGAMPDFINAAAQPWASRRNSITSVFIGDGVSAIGNYAFYACTILTEVTIPNSVTTIRSSAFYGCTLLTEVTIPNSVTSIGSEAFRGCSSLTEIYNYATSPQNIFSNVFTNVNKTACILRVPAGSVNDYRNATGWSEFVNILSIGEPITLTASPSSLNFIEANEQKTFLVISNISWTVSSSATWLTVAPASGNNDGTTVPVTVTANTTTSQRTAIITLRGPGGVEPQTITVTQAGVPGSPQGFAAVAGNMQVTLSWSAPESDGGSAITGYEVSSDNGATWLPATSNTGHIFTDLTNGTEYTITVRAVNAAGGGAEASAKATPRTIPDAPQDFKALAGNMQVTLSWSAPAFNGGSAITGYQVSSNSGTTWVNASNNTGHTFTGLTNGVEYSFKVRAVNVAGNGAEASASAMPFLAVTEIIDVPSSATIGVALALTGTVVPSDATMQAIVWSVSSAGTTGAVISGNTLYVTMEGTVLILATIKDGLEIGKDYEQAFFITVGKPVVSVTNIKDVPTTVTAGTPLTLAGTVEPADATNQTIIWSVITAGTTGSTISGNTLNAKTEGTVEVLATIKDGLAIGKDYEKVFFITVVGKQIVAVTNITDVPTSATAGTPLTLSGTVAPSNATNKSIVWSVFNAGGTGATINGATLTTTAAGTATVRATITDGLDSGSDYKQNFEITVTNSYFVEVAYIMDVPTTATAGTPLILAAKIFPASATNQTIVWSVLNAGSTGATISGNILTAKAAGTVAVSATITDGLAVGSDYMQIFEITVGSVTATPELASANPLRVWIRDGMLHIEGLTIGETLSIYSASGVMVYQSVAASAEADIPLSAQGVYIVQSGERMARVVKE